MKTSEAIQAIRPLVNQFKALGKLEEVLNLIQERESIIEESQTRLDTLTNKIESADKRYAEMQQRNREAIVELEGTIAAKRQELENAFEARRLEINTELAALETSLKNSKAQNQQSLAKLKDEEAVLTNSIRDKNQELSALAERLKSALTGTQLFINKVNTEGSGGSRVE